MVTKGFEEAQAAFFEDSAAGFVGEVRRFGPDGPAYEVVDRSGPGEVRIVVVQSGEQLDYPIADLLADPVADTVP
jgi:hypothetical protein